MLEACSSQSKMCVSLIPFLTWKPKQYTKKLTYNMYAKSRIAPKHAQQFEDFVLRRASQIKFCAGIWKDDSPFDDDHEAVNLYEDWKDACESNVNSTGRD